MVNETVLQGRLTADPELKHTQSAVAYTEFTVAWSEKYKDTETKLFLRCKAWRYNADCIWSQSNGKTTARKRAAPSAWLTGRTFVEASETAADPQRTSQNQIATGL